MADQFRHTSLRLIEKLVVAFSECRADPEVAYAAVGNLAHECGGFLLMEEGKPVVSGSLGGIGFAQWTGPRRRQYMEHCRKHNLHPYGYDANESFLLWELCNTEKAIPRTAKAKPLSGTMATSPLQAKTVAFELAYERAGTKHYASRHTWARRAAQVHAEWRTAAHPIEKYVMPRARFCDDFDREFGSGESETTRRLHPPGSAAPAPPLPLPPLPAATVVKGRWPEDTLTPTGVRAVQQRLRLLGYTQVGRPDGDWGPKTAAAVKAFQGAARLRRDGHYGPATRKAMQAAMQAATRRQG